ncbi:PBP/GOBP family [Popillia japonica]|uniref:PBP/GOBP family n=1 Tax=Popillia japonica TaxID=7064 RepID=A0AAW1LV09_POPJA
MNYQLILLFLASLWFENAISINEAQMKAGIKLIKNTCRTKTKITDEQIAKMHEGVWDDDDDVTKCYCHCALGMMKLQAKNGAFDHELFEKQKPIIPEVIRDPLIASVNNCVNAGEGLTKKCDLSYAFFKCVYLDDPEHYMFP